MLTSDLQLFCLSLPTARISGIHHICLDFFIQSSFSLVVCVGLPYIGTIAKSKGSFFFLCLLL